MNKKVIISLLLIAVMAFGAGLGTFAWFTSQATSASNTFDTAELKIGGIDGEAIASFSFDSLYPGEEGAQEEEIAISNNGDIDLKYKVTAAYAGDSKALFDMLDVKVTRPAGGIVYEGALKDLDEYMVSSNLAKGTAENIKFKVSLPGEAGNQYMGKLVNVNFVFDATQYNNTTTNWANEMNNPIPKEVIEGGIITSVTIAENTGELAGDPGEAYSFNIKFSEGLQTGQRLEVLLYNTYGNLLSSMSATDKQFDGRTNTSGTFVKEEAYYFASRSWNLSKWNNDINPTIGKCVVRLTTDTNIYESECTL